jgi:hypothetical protein
MPRSFDETPTACAEVLRKLRAQAHPVSLADIARVGVDALISLAIRTTPNAAKL